jgi:putative RNA 2'-phosphotransferase
VSKDKVTKSSKFLSLVLRHEPGFIGITLDSTGWVPVSELLRACHAHGQPLTLEGLHEVVARNDKQRFAFSEDGRKIRAN